MSSDIDLMGSADEPAMRRSTTADSNLVDELWCGQELEGRLAPRVSYSNYVAELSVD